MQPNPETTVSDTSRTREINLKDLHPSVLGLEKLDPKSLQVIGIEYVCFKGEKVYRRDVGNNPRHAMDRIILEMSKHPALPVKIKRLNGKEEEIPSAHAIAFLMETAFNYAQ